MKSDSISTVINDRLVTDLVCVFGEIDDLKKATRCEAIRNSLAPMSRPHHPSPTTEKTHV